jgi:hypothetical protein
MTTLMRVILARPRTSYTANPADGLGFFVRHRHAGEEVAPDVTLGEVGAWFSAMPAA